MNLRLIAGKFYLPESSRKRILKEIFQVTADAFKGEVPSLEGLDSNMILRSYAAFTSENAGRAIGSKDGSSTEVRLFNNAHKLGQRVRNEYKIKDLKDSIRLARIVYKVLGIEFHGNASGEILIRRCYFSQYYSPGICRLVSALDEGFLTSISGGSKLSFTHRITDGDACCRAHLAIEKEK